MNWTPWLLGSFAAVMIAGCGGERRSDDAGTAGSATETGTMQGTGTTSDTLPGSDTAGIGATTGSAPSDTATGGARIQSDTNRPGTANPDTSAGAGAATGTSTTPPDTARQVHDSTAGTSH